MKNKNLKIWSKILPFILAVAVVIIDQISKILVVNYNDSHNHILQGSPENYIKLIGDWLRIKLVYNPNMGFGLNFGLTNQYKQFILMGITTLAIIVVIVILTKIKKENLFVRGCMGLLIGGGWGNLVDRTFGYMLYKGECKLFFERGVVDWIDAGIPKGLFGLENGWRWNTFNLADSFAVIGVLLLILALIINHDKDFFETKKTKKPNDKESTKDDKESTETNQE